MARRRPQTNRGMVDEPETLVAPLAELTRYSAGNRAKHRNPHLKTDWEKIMFLYNRKGEE